MTSLIKIPNANPIRPTNKIAIVGDFGDNDDEIMRQPFIGSSGAFLSSAMKQLDIDRSATFLGNIAPYKINPWRGLSYYTEELDEGLTDLKAELNELNPNVVVVMGQDTLNEAGQHQKIQDYRGSLFKCQDQLSPFYNYKCLAALHPRTLIKQYDKLPLFMFDLKRAKEESSDPDLSLPQRVFDLHLTANEICSKLDNWDPSIISCIDIEGGVNPEMFGGIACISIAESPNYAFIIDLKNMHAEDMPKVYRSLKRWMEDVSIKKIMQGALYEMFCIPHRWGMQVNGLIADTMLSGYEIYAELPKALGVQASIWTREPYYKDERTVLDDNTHNRYCCKDTTVTYEIALAHDKHFEENPESREHYELNLSLIPLLSYVQMKGFNYDENRAKEKLEKLLAEQSEFQSIVETTVGKAVNINSHVQVKDLLYNHFKFPKQYEGYGRNRKVTGNGLALLTLLRKYKGGDGEIALINMLKWKKLEGIRKQLLARRSPDGRMRSAYNPVGTDTGRFTCYKSNDGTGFNLQTAEPSTRELYIPDEGKYLAKIDLDGADGWTVACHCLAAGDDTMFNDLSQGVKPAKVVCASYLLRDPTITKMSQDELKVIISQLTIEPWLYAAAKMVVYGSFYGMKEDTMSNNILVQSWKKSGDPIYVEPDVCLNLQTQHFFKRYGAVQDWQDRVQDLLEDEGVMPSASGHTRRFFGRLTDPATLRTALSHEPQINTTYATSLAASRLQLDPNNYNPDGSYKLEPIHQVHDELVVQFNKHQVEKRTEQFKEYFNNTITIAGIDLVVPFSGGVGNYWEDYSVASI